jgi:aminobutyraldehyde dehydrogenase
VRAADRRSTAGRRPRRKSARSAAGLADAIEAHGEELARLESDNCGKPYAPR